MAEDTTTGVGPTDGAGGGRAWREDAEAALDDVGTALQAAWEGSREARVAALEAAKGALTHLGTAIDQASRAARDSWGDDATPPPAPDTSPGPAEPAAPVEPPPPPADPPATDDR